MILRGIHVENWRCIRKLDLPALSDGINVLFGPNRTGKTSLLRAMRCCLFDADHNSSARDIASSLPWNGEGPPKVTVEFTTDGVDYRLTKVFSRTKEGKALLEKKVGDLWRVEQDAPKEASRRARELLRADKSTAGLNQLLWLGQGEIGLSEQSLDMSLQQKLSGILGVMVTGRDLGFRAELDRRCGKWFTATSRDAKNSLIGQIEQQRNKCAETNAREKESFAQYEEALRRLQARQDELPGLEKTVTDARWEFDQLTEESDRCRERLRQYHQSKSALEIAERNLQLAAENLKKFKAAQDRWQSLHDQLAKARSSVQAAEERRQQVESQHDKAMQLLASARQAEEEFELGREEIEDRRRLLTLAEQTALVDQKLLAVAKNQEEIARLEAETQTLLAPDEKTMAALRTNRRHAAELRAQLKATEWILSIDVEKNASIDLALDGLPPQSVQVAPGEKPSWSLRQRGQIHTGEFGTIGIGPAQENHDLVRTARELEQTDRLYHDQVLSFQEDPEDESCLDRLTARRIQRDAALARLRTVRAEGQELAPDGAGICHTQRETLGQHRLAILQRRPTWATWQPCQTDVAEFEKQFNSRARQLRVSREETEAQEKSARIKLAQAESKLQEQREMLAATEGAEGSEAAELKRLGEEGSLQQQWLAANEARQQVERLLAANQLTEAELTVEERCKEAETALSERGRRLEELKGDLRELRGILLDKEGLHTKLADSEAVLKQVEVALAREKLEAAAHKRLRELFDACREDKVRQVMGPIAIRVLDWSQKIGLDDCQEISFGDAFLPQGIRLKNPIHDEPIALDEESYGTWEQLSIIVRLALGGVLAKDEPQVAILDDPLAHTDTGKHRKILDILRLASEGNPSWNPPAGRLQVIILTCHPDRFDHLPGAKHIDLTKHISR